MIKSKEILKSLSFCSFFSISKYSKWLCNIKSTKDLLDDYFSLDVERRQLVADLIKQMKKNQ